jgi:hypothetical protein
VFDPSLKKKKKKKTDDEPSEDQPNVPNTLSFSPLLPHQTKEKRDKELKRVDDGGDIRKKKKKR